MSNKENPPKNKNQNQSNSTPFQPSLLDLNGCNTKNNILDMYESSFKKRDLTLRGWRRKK